MPETNMSGTLKVDGLNSANDTTEVRIMLARFETKLDLVLGQHGQKLDDHEGRLRAVEDRKTVSPSQLLATSAKVVALMGGSFTVLDRLLAK